MNVKDRQILDDFKKERENFIRLEDVVGKIIRDTIKDAGILVSGVEHRVKSADSLEVKLYKNGDYYQKLSDLMDLLGARIICYFPDDVDKLGKLIEEKFEIDYEFSSDKRALVNANSFGYMSLHYICSLKKDEGYPEELTNKRFEIQIRTILQHAWAAINHDLGYKNDFGVPKEVVREFARLAGLLELADDEFARARDHINEYTETVREKIINDNAGDVLIDLVSLREYMLRNKKMREFLDRLAKIEGSEITESAPDNYINQLNFLEIKTIGDLQALLEKNGELAYSIAKGVLTGTELDILASNVALRFLCQSELVRGKYSEEKVVEFLSMTIKDEKRAQRQAKRIIKMQSEID